MTTRGNSPAAPRASAPVKGARKAKGTSAPATSAPAAKGTAPAAPAAKGTSAPAAWQAPAAPAKRRVPRAPARKVRRAFSRETLARVCTMHETDFAKAYGMTRYPARQAPPADFYLHRDNGSNILAVAHLDTVVPHTQRGCRFLDTVAGGSVVYSGALDDRLGAYIILDLLPALGIQHDILLTVGEESGRSTAAFFDSPSKDYDWIIEFDRGGTDVVMYQYDDAATADLVWDCGARVGEGIFSDICYLEHLGVKAFNWGVGYRDYHGTRSHAWLDDTYLMVAQYLNFHAANAGKYLYHYDHTSAAEADAAYAWDLDAAEAAEAEEALRAGDIYADADPEADPYWRRWDDEHADAIARADRSGRWWEDDGRDVWTGR